MTKSRKTTARVAQFKLVPVTRGGFRWKLVASNGAVVCVSADKFAKRSNAYRAIRQARVVANAATASLY